MRLSAVATSASSRERGDQPRSRFALSDVAFFDLPSSGTIWRTDESASEARRTSQSGSSRVDARRAASPRRVFRICAISRRVMKSPATARKRSPLASGIGHGAQVQVGDVAHVHHPECHVRQAGHRAAQDALDDDDRGRGVGSEHGTEHADRIDDGELRPAVLDEIPGRALGDRLRLDVGGSPSPWRLVQLVSSNGAACSLWP